MDEPLEELFESSLGPASQEQSLKQLPHSRGLVLFADAQKQPIQLLSAAGLRRTALAKLSEFDPGEPTRKTDLRPIAAFLYYTPVISEFHGTWFYNRLVHRLFPETAGQLISLPPPHCVRIIPDEPWAAFAASVHPFRHDSGIYFGPFPARKAADSFAQLFNNIFALCRNRPLALSGQGPKCSYFQMGLCPGPCMQKGAEIQYRQTVQQALEAASGSVQDLQETLMAQMKILAGKMQFEQAQLIKDQLQALLKLRGNVFRWTRRLKTLRILHICRGPRIRTADNLRKKHPSFCAYLISSDEIHKLPNFSFSSIGRLPDFLSHPPAACRMRSKSAAEHLSLLSLYLYKSKPPGLWLDLHNLPEPDEQILSDAVREGFRDNESAEDE